MMHRAKKRFGQNFLNDTYIIEQIIAIINPQTQDFLVEIGPGLGALTTPLLQHLIQLHAIELDRDIVALLKTNFKSNLIIHEADALKFDFTLFKTPKLRVVGNLPYNISTPLLFHLAKFSHIADMHFMLQKEVVERICASPDCHSYGRLSIMLQYRFDCRKMLDVSREFFDPKPQVESAIIRLCPKPREQWQDIDEKKLNLIVTQAFGQRRKTVSNSLKNLISKESLEQLHIDTNKRAENLTVAEYLKLATLPLS